MSTLTLASTHNVKFDVEEDDYKGRYEGTDYRWWVLFIPVQGVPDIKEATDKVLEQGRGNLLLNAVMYYQEYGLPPLLGVSGYRVKGDVYILED